MNNPDLESKPQVRYVDHGNGSIPNSTSASSSKPSKEKKRKRHRSSSSDKVSSKRRRRQSRSSSSSEDSGPRTHHSSGRSHSKKSRKHKRSSKKSKRRNRSRSPPPKDKRLSRLHESQLRFAKREQKRTNKKQERINKKHNKRYSQRYPKKIPTNMKLAQHNDSPPDTSQKLNKGPLVDCVCGIDIADGIMLECKHCEYFSHGSCYGINSINIEGFKHTCGKCSIKHNEPCTNLEIGLFYQTGNKSPEERQQFRLALLLKRAAVSYYNHEFYNFVGLSDIGVTFLRLKLHIDKNYASNLLKDLCCEGFIQRKPTFAINYDHIRTVYDLIEAKPIAKQTTVDVTPSPCSSLSASTIDPKPRFNASNINLEDTLPDPERIDFCPSTHITDETNGSSTENPSIEPSTSTPLGTAGSSVRSTPMGSEGGSVRSTEDSGIVETDTLGGE